MMRRKTKNYQVGDNIGFRIRNDDTEILSWANQQDNVSESLRKLIESPERSDSVELLLKEVLTRLDRLEERFQTAAVTVPSPAQPQVNETNEPTKREQISDRSNEPVKISDEDLDTAMSMFEID
ncbi:hypothetical protein EMIT07CA2_550010 [Brevibacillus sp. IT-7CA2]